MAIYRNIQISFWTDPKIADDFTPEDKFFYLYLMTNPHTSICGCYEISMKQMSDETGYSKETVEKLINRMMSIHNVIRYSKETKEMLILNWHKYNWTSSARVREGILIGIRHTKNSAFRQYLQALYEGHMNVTIGSCEGIPTSFMFMFTDNNNISNSICIEEDRGVGEEETATKKTDRDVAEEIFNRLWKKYPRKMGKGQISASRKLAVAKIGEAKMSAAIDRFIADMTAQNRPMDKIMYGSTFFNSGYVDYLEDETSGPPNKMPEKRERYEPDYVGENEQRFSEGWEVVDGYWIPPKV